MKKSLDFSPSLLLILSFAGAILIGTFLLMLPFSTVSGSISFVNALFTATSAVCVTGLIVVDTATYFTTFGQTIILILFQLGGLGIMTFTSLVILLARGDISFSEKSVIEDSFLSKGGVDLKRFIKDIFIFTFLIEFSGMLLLYFNVFSKHFKEGKAFFHSLFHSVSAFNNAGFSTFSDSLVKYQSSVSLNLVIVFEIIIGGLGFFVVRDIYYFVKARGKNKFSLHSKLVIVTTFILIVVGFGIFLFLENDHSLAGKDKLTKILISLFQSATPRTAGFNTVDLTLITHASAFLLIIFMVIGASPGSTGGGMKTTTWAALLLFLRTKLKGKNNVQAFGRNIAWEIVDKAHLILLFSIIVIFSGVLLISFFEGDKFSLLQVFFEEVSAYGTVGLSLGITSKINSYSKLVLIATMFVGRVGILNIIYAFVSEKRGANYEYPEEKIIVG